MLCFMTLGFCSIVVFVSFLCNLFYWYCSAPVIMHHVGARWPSGLERWLGMATGHSQPSNTTSVKTFRFGTLAIPFTPICQCLSDETLEAAGPFYLVSMPGEVKDPTSPHRNV